MLGLNSTYAAWAVGARPTTASDAKVARAAQDFQLARIRVLSFWKFVGASVALLCL